jgi:hypothetical protein
MAEEPVPASQRKGPSSEMEPAGEPLVTEGSV